jgi:O-antigen/teichoic acid export membrane protein
MSPDAGAAAARETAKGGAILFGGKLFAYASRLVIAVFVARGLGTAAYGTYNLALTVADLVSAAARLGLDTALVRFIPVNEGRGDERATRAVLQAGIGIPFVMATVLAVPTFLAAEAIATGVFGDAALTQPLQLGAVAIPLLVVMNQLDAGLKGLRKLHYGVLAQQVGQPVVRFGLILIVLVVGITVNLTLAAFLAAAAATCVAMLWLLHRERPLNRRATISRAEAGSLIRFSLPIYLSSLVMLFGDGLHKILLGSLVGVASVGIFAVAIQVNLIGTVFYGSITTAAMPIIAALHDQGDHRALSSLYRVATKWAITVNLPVFLVLVTFPDLVLAIFGEGFQEGATALVILAVANLANVATGPCGAILDMAGYTTWKLVNSVAMVVLSVVSSLALIPALGVVGAALSVLVVTSTLNLLRALEVRFLLALAPYDRSTLKPIAAFLLALGAVLAGQRLVGPDAGVPFALAAIAAAWGIYLVAIIGLGIAPEDRALLVQVRSRASRRGRRR